MDLYTQIFRTPRLNSEATLAIIGIRDFVEGNCVAWLRVRLMIGYTNGL